MVSIQGDENTPGSEVISIMSWHIFNPEKAQRGAAVIEFSLVVPLLLLLLFGIIEFSLLVYNKHIITNASREGARYGIVITEGARHNQDEIREVVKDWVSQEGGDGFLVTFGTDTITDGDIVACSLEQGAASWVCANDTTSNFGDKLRVTITYDYDFLLIPSFITSLAGGVKINAETIMNYE